MSLVKAVGHKLSQLLANNPKILFKIQEGWLRFGHDVLDLRMANWVVRRPEWLRAKSNNDRATLLPPLGLEAEVNIDIANRIIAMSAAASQKNQGAIAPQESMWGTLLQTHYGRLRSLVEKGDGAELAKFQSHIFRTETVNGYTYGSTFDSWPHRWHYLPVQIELSVVQLAESLGLIRAECHEQGETAFWRRICSEEELIGKLEDFFGFRIEQPRFGDPKGILFGGRFLTRETCSHLYTAHRMRTAIDRKGIPAPLKIVEIGGGFGGTCYWLRKLLGQRITHYAIVDLPEVGLVQASFLGSQHPEDLALEGENAAGKESIIQLIPHFAIEDIDFQPNVLINQDSMPEMPQSEVERYLDWATRNLDGLFLSFNQETYNPFDGVHQNYLPEIVSRFPKFARISRDASWDRRGYVEEVYETS